MATSQTSSGTSTYSYNNGNQLTAKTTPSARTFTYDAQGNQITDTGKTLTYNYDNQLKTYQSGSLTTTYAYDTTGNRIDKTQTGTGAVNYQYINAGNNQVLQAKNLTAGTNQYYVYGLEQISQGDTSSSTRQYPITDGTGTVRYLTNSSGTTVTNGTFAYDTYGKQTSGSASLTNYNYQSEQKDSESSLVYLRARYYDPSIGRFTSQDPMSGTLSNPASQNGYNYANNNPVNLSDPTGELPTIVIGAILGGAIGTASGGVSYAITTQNFNLRDLGANMAGGATGGAITGACLGTGVGLFVAAACGAAGGASGELITQRLDSTQGYDGGNIVKAGVLGAVGSKLGSIGAAKINRGWLSLANSNANGLSAKNLIPGLATGSLGRKLQQNSLIGGAGDTVTNLLKCAWGSL